MERRKFIKSSCNFCLLGAAGILATNLSGCSPAAYPVFKTEVNNNIIEIPLTLFDKAQLQFIRPKGLYHDIAVHKKEDTYTALLLECTHQENSLTPTGNGYHCNFHGSEFDKDGRVKKGPAELPLKKYKTSINQNNLIIHV